MLYDLVNTFMISVPLCLMHHTLVILFCYFELLL